MTKVWNHIVSFQLKDNQYFEFLISKPGLNQFNNNILQQIFANNSTIAESRAKIWYL